MRTSLGFLRKQAAGALLAASFCVAAPSAARADAPPPDGNKYVGYSFIVEGLDAYPDFVLLAFPTSASNGAPTFELSIVSNGEPVRLGRRSSTPKLYLIKKADFDVWNATRDPNASPDARDEAAAELVKTPMVIPCEATLSPSFMLPTSDSRSTITEKLKIAEATESTCKVVAAEQSQNNGSSGEPASTNKSGGCAGCTIDDRASAVSASLCAALAAAAVFVSRRRASQRKTKRDR